MKNSKSFRNFNLQLFADGNGGDGGTGAEGATGETAAAAVSQPKGVKNNPLAAIQYGKQEEVQTASVPDQTIEKNPDRETVFEELIKGEYKDLYDAKVQAMIQKRLKGTKDTVDKYQALSPTLEILARKYGVKSDDIEALNKAIEEDDSYFEEEADQKGVTVEQLKRIRKMERENAELKRQMEEKETRENASKLYAAWMNQAEQVKGLYPSFDLNAEMQNPKFLDLLRSNVDVRTAYEVLHKDEILPAAMQFTAKTVEQKLTNKMIAGGARPPENGTNSQSTALVKSDVSQLSKADREEIIRRVQRGEKIRF